MRRLLFKLFGVAVMLSAMFLAMAATRAGGTALAQNRIIILDATNSMWGPIEGGRKYMIARDAIASAAGNLEPQSRLGLYVTGNQPGAGCESITEALPYARLDRDALDTALDNAIPDRGRLPLFPAIERAVETIQSAGGEGRILVIADGAGTCVPDTCAAASRLNERASGLRIDAVSLNADAGARRGLECITQATGGAYTDATSQAELAAFVQTTMSGDAKPDTPEPRPKAAARKSIPPLPGINPFRPGQSPVVTLRAVLSQGQAPIQQGLAWRIRGAGSGEDAPVVWRGADAEPDLNLPQGPYRVEVQYGTVSASREIEVQSRRGQAITIDLNAGVLKLSGAAHAGGEPVSDIFYYVHEVESGATATGALVARSSQPQPDFFLPAGRYRIIARHGLAEAVDTVELDAGATLGRNLALNAGTLRVKATLADGQEAPRGTLFLVHERSDDGGWQEIARSAQREPAFTLPAGSYRIDAQLEAARANATVDIAAGEESAQTLRLAAGRVRIQTQLEGRTQPVEAGVVYRMFRRDGGEAELVHTTAQARYEGFLPAQQYRIESTYGIGNVVEAQDVTVEAGETQSLTFTHKAGRAQLGLVEVQGGLTLGGVSWSIRNSAGQEVFTSTDSVPEPDLRAGQYVAIAERDGKSVRKAFTVAPNRTTVVELVAQ